MTTSARPPRICVVGSSIIDMVTYAPRLPKIGETLPGSRFDTAFGGKGANQAAMAALLGADVSMISKVGEDSAGRDYLANLAALGIDATYVSVSTTASTGVAPIWVDESTGANAIIVVLGANDELSVADVAAASSAITAADVVIGQWEVPIECVVAAFRIARDHGVRTVFNPAPARGALPAEIYALIDVFCPNESETELLTGMSVATLPDVELAARTLLARGPSTVVVTLGERGALIVDTTGAAHHAAPIVHAVDTTGAGDAFVGALSTMLAAGRTLPDAVGVAIATASESVQRPGTQKSYADHRATSPWL
jgi:ribokinase